MRFNTLGPCLGSELTVSVEAPPPNDALHLTSVASHERATLAGERRCSLGQGVSERDK